MEQAINQIIELLQPFKGTGEACDEYDRFGPDEPIRDILSAVLKRMDVYGMGGCPLCGS